MDLKINYEIVLLFYSYVNDEAITSAMSAIFSPLGDNCILESSNNIGRYDVNITKKIIKANMICAYFSCSSVCLKAIKEAVKTNTEIVRSILLKKNNKLIPKIVDYKYPIEMKKYIFESMRIIPIELTGFNKRKQRILATNIKRARILGLIGRNIK